MLNEVQFLTQGLRRNPCEGETTAVVRTRKKRNQMRNQVIVTVQRKTSPSHLATPLHVHRINITVFMSGGTLWARWGAPPEMPWFCWGLRSPQPSSCLGSGRRPHWCSVCSSAPRRAAVRPRGLPLPWGREVKGNSAGRLSVRGRREGSAGVFNSPGRRISQPLDLALQLSNGRFGLRDVSIFLGCELHELLDRSLDWV